MYIGSVHILARECGSYRNIMCMYFAEIMTFLVARQLLESYVLAIFKHLF